MAKIRMPFYGIIGIFREFSAHIFAKYQYFSMRPSLFNLYYQTTYSLHISSQFCFKCGFHGRNTLKNPQNKPYLSLQFRIFSLEKIPSQLNLGVSYRLRFLNSHFGAILAQFPGKLCQNCAKIVPK